MNRRPPILLLTCFAVLAGLVLFLVLRACQRPRPADEAAGPAAAAAPARGAPDPAAAPAQPDAGGPQLRALVFHLGPDGLRLERSSVLPGRAKAPPRSAAADRIEFTACAADGRELWTGSIDHPLRRRFEVESAREPGRLEQVPAVVPENLFDLRLPAEPPVARLVFFEVRAGSTARTPIGEVTLP